MTPRLSVIGSSIRKLFAAIGGLGDYYWNNVVLAMKMDKKDDVIWNKVSLAMHMDDPDPYWSSTVLAMHMDSGLTDLKGHTITANGNATLSATQSKFGGYSCYFDGTGDYLSVPSSTDFDLPGDFTIEAWVNISTFDPVGGTSNRAILSFATTTVSNTTPCILIGATGYTNPGKLSFFAASSILWTNSTLTLSTWTHIALVRSGGTVTWYLNGTADGSATFSTAIDCSQVLIGRSNNTNGDYHGYIDDLRITKGVARYTGNFTPKTYPFREPVNYQFADEKSHAITAVGTPTISAAQSKFGGSSLLLNGTTDYLTIPTSTDYGFGTGDFTVECWVLTAASGALIDLRTTAGSLGLFAINSGFMAMWNGTGYVTGTTTLTGSTWFHLAWVRSKGTVTMYVNGAVDAVSYVPDDLGSTRPVRIGADVAGANFFAGNIDDLRITKGVARYVGEFSAPTYPFLEPNNKPTFVEETGKTVTAVGDATTSVLQSKFGGAAAYFDGAGDYLTIPHSSDTELGTSDFTIECWIYDMGGDSFEIAGYGVAATSGFYFVNDHLADSLAFGATNYGVVVSKTTALSLNVWHHVAVVRCNGAFYLFANGTLHASATAVLDLNDASSTLKVGTNIAISKYANGYIDDLRITKGIARYTSTFTPDTKTLQNYTKTYLDPYFDNVVLGLHMDGTNASTTFTDVKGKTVTAVGDAQISTAQSKFGGASGYFDGTGDALSLANSSDYVFGSGNFTIEGWIYPTTTSATAQDIVYFGNDANYTDCWFLRIYTSTGQFITQVNAGATIKNASVLGLVVNQWNHIALVRNGNSLTAYCNGVAGTSVDVTGHTHGTPVGTTPGLVIGREYHASGTLYYTGYIDDLRITKGVARYTANFQPVQLPFPNARYIPSPVVADPYYGNVVLGMHMDGADLGTTFTDVTGKTVTAVGNACTKTGMKMFGSASAYFDGTGGYLSIPSSPSFDFGTGDFTIELWFNETTPGALRQLVGRHSTNSMTQSSIILMSDSRVLKFSAFYGAGSVVDVYSPATHTLGVWHHVLVVRNGTTIRLFLDGAQVATGSIGANSVNSSSYILAIGAVMNTNSPDIGNYFFTGYIDDLRITKGVARYTETFTPPARFPEIAPTWYDPYFSNVVLLMHMDGTNGGTTFTDVKGKTVTPAGNVNTVTATKKYGTASAYFDGSGDYLTVPDSADWDFGTGDFTVESWVRLSGYSPNYVGNYAAAVIGSSNSYGGGQNGCWELGFAGTASSWTQVFFHTGYTTVPATLNFNLNTWYHIAVARSGSVLKLFVDGVQVASASNSDNVVGQTSVVMNIGRRNWATIEFYLNGYIDDLRITKGVARYTSNFALPPAPYPDVA